jgi:hypothetical protein
LQDAVENNAEGLIGDQHFEYLIALLIEDTLACDLLCSFVDSDSQLGLTPPVNSFASSPRSNEQGSD